MVYTYMLLVVVEDELPYVSLPERWRYSAISCWQYHDLSITPIHQLDLITPSEILGWGDISISVYGMSCHIYLYQSAGEVVLSSVHALLVVHCIPM